MRLFIAEKPSVAKAIAGELGITSKSKGYIECGQNTVTWCFGHMLEQAEPDEYTASDAPRSASSGKKLWRVEDLPIIPKEWKVFPKEDAKQQLDIISRLLMSADEVVNAGDPDREGQLLVDEILEYFKYSKRVLRFWVSAQDSTSIRRGLTALKDNSDYHGFGAAAQARGRADWLIGMNLSRAYTLRAQRGGSRTLLTVGRVQTPTLSLVVARDREIEAFKPMPFYTLQIQFQHVNGIFIARWTTQDNQSGLDSEGRLIDKAVADALITKLSGKTGSIAEYTQAAKFKGHPKSYSLSDITLVASNLFGYTAALVLEICQSLYETHKLTSYPRTDCNFLPESQHADAKLVLAAVKSVNPKLTALIDGADTEIKSKTWDDSKITAHHGIIPTMHKGSLLGLNEKEKAIYGLIVRAYLAQFYPLHEYMSTTVSVSIAGEQFRASGRVVIRNGWRDVYTFEDCDQKDKDESEEQLLPVMKQNDEVACLEAHRNDLKTKPPARFTEGTLQRAMENIHKFVNDDGQKKLLKDGDGIGTSATRAAIITELKRRDFLEPKGKQIVSTALGRSLVDALPDVVKSPVLTALYERMLKGIEQGRADVDSFLVKQEAFIRNQVANANSGAISIAAGNKSIVVSGLHKCSACDAGLSRRPSNNKKGSYWWGCSNYPKCKQTYEGFMGKPNYSKGRNNQETA